MWTQLINLGKTNCKQPILNIYGIHWLRFDDNYKQFIVDDETQLSHDPVFTSSHGTSVLTDVANNYTSSPAEEMSEEDNSKINEFLILLATCNTVVVSSHSHNATVSWFSIHWFCVDDDENLRFDVCFCVDDRFLCVVHFSWVLNFKWQTLLYSHASIQKLIQILSDVTHSNTYHIYLKQDSKSVFKLTRGM